ncbi:MAG TPA: S41 family peptidase [Gemmatimonadaceae bacterium]|jgi:carboxyl-terminal processing protease|nr:S41 family peptidase [Gemmatimonadaceae bacterium]
MSRLRTAALLGVIALPIVIGGAAIERQSTRDGAHVFDQVLSLVSDRFVDTLQQNQLFEKAARGLVQQLDDPYSELYTPAQLKRFSTVATGKYGGIGMQIEQQEGAIVVVRVFDHTPAEQAGVAEGDHIVGIDTASTRGWTSQQVSDVLIGTIGTKVNVKFARPGIASAIEHSFTRAEIHVPAVPYSLMLDNKIAYVPLQQFSENSAAELRANVNRLLHEGAKGIVLDLRSDPGGILDQGLDIADLFLGSGQTIASVRTRQGPPQVFTTHGGQHVPDVPLVVLVDGYSASASEIVTGALQDHDRALVVGTTSFGKGLVQTVFPLDGGWAMKLTTGKWYTPSGRSIQRNRKHIDPDSAAGASSDPAAGLSADAKPDSLEQDSVKKHRPMYKSDAGRTIYGGGGVTPDIIVPEDTVTTAEQEFAKAIAPKFPALRGVLYQYSFELKDHVAKDFTVTPAWRDELYKRLQTAKIVTDRKQYDAATPLVNRWLSQQVARLAFGDSTAFRRTIPDDPQLRKALDVLRKGQTQKDLFSIARADATPGH